MATQIRRLKKSCLFLFFKEICLFNKLSHKTNIIVRNTILCVLDNKTHLIPACLILAAKPPCSWTCPWGQYQPAWPAPPPPPAWHSLPCTCPARPPPCTHLAVAPSSTLPWQREDCQNVHRFTALLWNTSTLSHWYTVTLVHCTALVDCHTVLVVHWFTVIMSHCTGTLVRCLTVLERIFIA